MFTTTPIRRFLSSIALILLAGWITFLGRLAIDKLVIDAPQWSSEIEKFGSFAIGMAVVMGSVVPMLRINGVIKSKLKQGTSSAPPSSAEDPQEEVPK